MTEKKQTPVDKLTDDQILLLRDTFEDFDEAGEGEIGTDDLGAVLSTLGMECTEMELQTMIDEVDADGSGTIDFPEFVLMMADKMAPGKKLTLEEETVQAFASMDSSGDGFLDPRALIEMFTRMGNKMSKKDVLELMEVVGFDANGRIDYKKLVRIIHKVVPHAAEGESKRSAELKALKAQGDAQTKKNSAMRDLRAIMAKLMKGNIAMCLEVWRTKMNVALGKLG